MRVPDLGTMLVVGAHPDDETFTTGGLMARAVAEGRRVVCVTATRGEEGSLDPARWPPAEMGTVREAELDACLAVLGVNEHHWLDYHDGRCAQADHDEAVAKVRAIMREVQPDSVLVFGPDGMTGHPDHKTVSAWTTAAFTDVARPGACLYYATQTPAWVERFLPLVQRFNVFPEGPPVTPVEDLAIHFPLPPDLLGTKFAALSEQRSQIEHMIAAFGGEAFELALAEESFVLGGRKP